MKSRKKRMRHNVSHQHVFNAREGVDLMPASIELSGVEISLVNAMSRETILRQYVEIVKSLYDFILVDTSPSLGMLSINSLATADSVIIPVQAEYLPAKGLELLLKTIARVRRQINPAIKIDGILLIQCGIGHMDRHQTAEYIKTHLKYASCQKNIFSDAAIDDIFQFSRGISRLVNETCTSSLIFAAQNRKSIIDDRMAKLVIDCELS